jgi:hypothetical protein
MKSEQWMEIGVCGRYSTPFFHSIFRWDLGVLAIPFAPLELSHKAPLRRYYRQLASQTGKRDAGYPFVVEDIRFSNQRRKGNTPSLASSESMSSILCCTPQCSKSVWHTEGFPSQCRISV